MCVSAVVNLLFNITLVAALILTLVAVFLPQWVTLRNTDVHSEYQQGFDHGFFQCLKQLDDCTKSFWHNLNDWQRTTVICLLASACLTFATLVVSTILCCCLCCCRSCFQWTLPTLTAFALTLQIIGIAVYGANTKSEIYSSDNTRYEPKLGSSFWIGLAGAGALLIGVILGIFLARMAKSSAPI